jgi:hypothetical protein
MQSAITDSFHEFGKFLQIKNALGLNELRAGSNLLGQPMKISGVGSRFAINSGSDRDFT